MENLVNLDCLNYGMFLDHVQSFGIRCSARNRQTMDSNLGTSRYKAAP